MADTLSIHISFYCIFSGAYAMPRHDHNKVEICGAMALRFGLIAVVVLTFACCTSATTLLGSSIAYTHRTYPGVPNSASDVFGVPGNQAWGQPGLRAGYLNSKGGWDVFADVGVAHKVGPIGGDLTALEIMPQAQANAHPWRGPAVFVNAGLGVLYERESISKTRSLDAIRPIMGTGVGIRGLISEGHGLLRLELRYDYVGKHISGVAPQRIVVFPATNLCSVKCGFDLLLGPK